MLWLDALICSFCLALTLAAQLKELIREMNFKATLVMSNVSGPPDRASISDNEITDIMFYGIGPVPLYVGFLTYNGKVKCGIVADSKLPNPSRIARHWQHEMKALWSEVNEMPGPLPPPQSTLGDWAYCVALLSLPAVLVFLLLLWIGPLLTGKW